MSLDQSEVWLELSGLPNRVAFAIEQPVQPVTVRSCFYVGTEADLQVLIEEHQAAIEGAVVKRI